MYFMKKNPKLLSLHIKKNTRLRLRTWTKPETFQQMDQCRFDLHHGQSHSNAHPGATAKGIIGLGLCEPIFGPPFRPELVRVRAPLLFIPVQGKHIRLHDGALLHGVFAKDCGFGSNPSDPTLKGKSKRKIESGKNGHKITIHKLLDRILRMIR
jgi:hypothetical protein